MRDYILGLVRDGRIAVGMEGDEPDLAYAVKKIGSEPFMFSSDFPHEVNAGIVREEIGRLRDDPETSDEAKRAILGGNAARFFGLS
jgi:predicted TIM-barrel fold metal-dependent hydrolase